MGIDLNTIEEEEEEERRRGVGAAVRPPRRFRCGGRGGRFSAHVGVPRVVARVCRAPDLAAEEGELGRADAATDEVYAQFSLVAENEVRLLLVPDFSFCGVLSSLVLVFIKGWGSIYLF
ncbi:hypothetical protein BHM03_00057348 [Ensete ventricosum]|nr:hypothetical protein BHM03_00057348 [Ensete ventricosum]